MVAHFNRSSKATTRLKELTSGRILRRYCKTRWSSFYNVIDRLLTLQDNVITVCIEQRFDGLMSSQWDKLAQLREILEPFSRFTNDLQAYKTSTLPLVLPCIQDLIVYLNQINQPWDLVDAVEEMSQNLSRRFDFILDSATINYNPTYLIATALDPRNKAYLSEIQISNAKLYLVAELKSRLPSSAESHQIGSIFSIADDDTNTVATEGGTVATEGGTPVQKRFRYVNKRVRNPTAEYGPPAVEQEVEKFLRDPFELAENGDPLSHWISDSNYPLLADLAVDYMVAPCSSSAVESLFSHAGLLSSGLRSRVSPENLESQVLIKTNWSALK